MKKFFWMTLGCFLTITLVFSGFIGKKSSTELSIDQQIEQLEEKKRGYEAKAVRFQNAGERLQFQKDSLTDARRYFLLAEKNHQAAEEVQQQIDALKKKKGD